jgi:DNA-binding response OmpR family regulator
MRDEFPLQKTGHLVKSWKRIIIVMASEAKILIVEDDMPVAIMMSFLLRRAGCETKVVTTGKGAMQMAEVGNFDLITLDVDLPDDSGFNLCSNLKKHPRLCHTPVVFVSGRSCLEDQQHGLDVGATDYITKPFDSSDFISRIFSQLTRKASIAYTGNAVPVESETPS